MHHLRPTTAKIDLEQLAENFRIVRSHVPTSAKILVAVKGDAYGHGALDCARVLADSGADWFGVALVEEGRELREGGIKQPILCMGGTGPFGAEAAIEYALTPMVSLFEEAEALQRVAQERATIARIHAKIDTGMGRLGVPIHLWPHFLDKMADLDRVQITGVASHLAESESSSGGIQTAEQVRRFEEAMEVARMRGVHPEIAHIANSGAILQHHGAAFDMVRPGLLIYGYDPLGPSRRVPVGAVMNVETQILAVRDLPAGVGVSYGGDFVTARPSRIATLPVGYADGYPRSLSDRASVLVKGYRAPVRGRVCMDMCMIDLTDIPVEVRPGDKVVLLGRLGDDEIDAWQLAEWADTIPYEILTGISNRIPRVS